MLRVTRNPTSAGRTRACLRLSRSCRRSFLRPGTSSIRVNIMPKKLKHGENTALTTPMSFMGTAAELDAQLPGAIVSFVASHLELKNTLARAKEEMDAAAKAE